ncbi:hypothetical protein CLOM_g12817 [Closterium sp. NIES-68]|nr:hypothetical protein CLOM_g12817 [Closterium sp. NIES-68]
MSTPSGDGLELRSEPTAMECSPDGCPISIHYHFKQNYEGFGGPRSPSLIGACGTTTQLEHRCRASQHGQSERMSLVGRRRTSCRTA